MQGEPTTWTPLWYHNLLERFFNWIESKHWTSKVFSAVCGYCMWMTVFMGCVILSVLKGEDWTLEFRQKGGGWF